MAYAFIRRMAAHPLKDGPTVQSISLNHVERVSVWISDELAQIAGEELENLLTVHVWMEDGNKKIYDRCVDVEVL